MSAIKFTPTPQLLAIPETDRIRWAEALESGEFEQNTIGALYQNRKYCCLGVWDQINHCVYRSDDQFTIKLRHSSTEGFSAITEIPNFYVDSENRLPPAAVKEKNGFRRRWGLHTLNDTCKLTFPQIALLLRGNEVVINE